MEWRCYEEEQQRLQEEQRAIELKQQAHQEEYRKERAELSHLSWRQRKSAMYRAYKNKFGTRSGEKVASDERRLQVIIKGAHAHTQLDGTYLAPPTDRPLPPSPHRPR